MDTVTTREQSDMPGVNDVALKALAEKVSLQERMIERLQTELQQARQDSIEVMLGQLRLREAVLLYVGEESADAFEKGIAETFGSEVARYVSNSLFVLNNAPVTPAVREAFRTATNCGMTRW